MARRILTPQQTEVLRLAGEGLTGVATARQLWLAETTVKWHRTRIIARLGARNLAHAYALAYRPGLL